jgi:hypothetical protein
VRAYTVVPLHAIDIKKWFVHLVKSGETESSPAAVEQEFYGFRVIKVMLKGYSGSDSSSHANQVFTFLCVTHERRARESKYDRDLFHRAKVVQREKEKLK